MIVSSLALIAVLTTTGSQVKPCKGFIGYQRQLGHVKTKLGGYLENLSPTQKSEDRKSYSISGSQKSNKNDILNGQSFMDNFANGKALEESRQKARVQHAGTSSDLPYQSSGLLFSYVKRSKSSNVTPSNAEGATSHPSQSGSVVEAKAKTSQKEPPLQISKQTQPKVAEEAPTSVSGQAPKMKVYVKQNKEEKKKSTSKSESDIGSTPKQTEASQEELSPTTSSTDLLPTVPKTIIDNNDTPEAGQTSPNTSAVLQSTTKNPDLLAEKPKTNPFGGSKVPWKSSASNAPAPTPSASDGLIPNALSATEEQLSPKAASGSTLEEARQTATMSAPVVSGSTKNVEVATSDSPKEPNKIEVKDVKGEEKKAIPVKEEPKASSKPPESKYTFKRVRTTPEMPKTQTVATDLSKDRKINISSGPFKVMTGSDRLSTEVLRNRPKITNDPSRKTLTQRIMESLESDTNAAQGAGGAGGRAYSTYQGFLQAEERWRKLRMSKPFEYDMNWLQKNQYGVPPPPAFVTEDCTQGNPKSWAKLTVQGAVKGQPMDYDVAVCGGTLGIFVALALQLQGYNVVVFEASKLKGRDQEWNISRKEMMELVELQLITEDDLEEVITTEFEGCRAGFKNSEEAITGGYFENGIGYECFIPNVLNLGVNPTRLLEIVKQNFEAVGGVVRELTKINGIVVSPSIGAAIDVSNQGGREELEPVTARLVLDCMGNASPVSAQQRYGVKPDGICAVVGTCAGGYDPKTNKIGDVIYTNTMIEDKTDTKEGKHQYFWEAFPVGIGRNGVTETDKKTTYMFTYLDAEEERPSLLSIMEDYWKLLPIYQPSIKNPETDLDISRILFAYFPTFRNSPLKPQWSRILAVGDASGIQSPLSFGGFGAMTRHLGRLTYALTDALDTNCLHKDDLGKINAYAPNLSAAWMFQKAMSVPKNKQNVNPEFINRLLANNFEVMNEMGDKTMLPFMQDVVRFDGLIASLTWSFFKDPLFTLPIVRHVGIGTLADWIGHVSMLGLYTGLHNVASPVIKPWVEANDDGRIEVLKLREREKFELKRKMEQWEYGSGSDYKFD